MPNFRNGRGVFHGFTTANMSVGHFTRAIIEGEGLKALVVVVEVVDPLLQELGFLEAVVDDFHCLHRRAKQAGEIKDAEYNPGDERQHLTRMARD